MIVLIMLFIILTLSFGIKIKLKISQEESLLVAVFGMGIIAYLFGIVNLLNVSLYIIAIRKYCIDDIYHYKVSKKRRKDKRINYITNYNLLCTNIFCLLYCKRC